MKPVATALACLLATSALAAPAGWQTYRNERFGSTADIPAGWAAGPPPENRDGLRFVSPDGRSSVAVSGSPHVHDRSTKPSTRSRSRGEASASRTRSGGGGGSSFPATAAGRIFYRKLGDRMSRHRLERRRYRLPDLREAHLDPLVTHISRSRCVRAPATTPRGAPEPAIPGLGATPYCGLTRFAGPV